jgi:hypothetical protein
MNRVLAAEPAIFFHFESVRVIFLVLHRVVIALLAIGASQGDLVACACLSHGSILRLVFISLNRVSFHKKKIPLVDEQTGVYHKEGTLSNKTQRCVVDG